MPKPVARKKEINWEAIRLLFATRVLSQGQLAEVTGIPEGTIAARAAREDWLGKKRARQEEAERLAKIAAGEIQDATTQPADASLATVPGESLQESGAADKNPSGTLTPLVEGVEQVLKKNRNRFKKGMSNALAKAAESAENLDGETIIAKGDKLASLARTADSVFGEDQQGNGQLVVSLAFLQGVGNPLAGEALPPMDAELIEDEGQEGQDELPALPEEADGE